MFEKIHWLGHSSFRIQDDLIVYIDPWKVASRALAADIILITHNHYDHLNREDIDRITASNTEIVIPKSCQPTFGQEAHVLSPGESIKVKGLKIDGVKAYNLSSGFHPRENDWLGYVVHFSQGSVYHAGDTDFVPEMESLDVDIALLPVGGVFTMTPEAAVEAAVAVNAGIAVPMHWGDVSGKRDTAETFVKLAADRGIDARIMNQER